MSKKASTHPSVAALMRRHFIAVSAEDSLSDVSRIIHGTRVRSLPVTRGDLLIGVICHRDIFEIYHNALMLPPSQAFRRLQELRVMCVEQAMKPVSEVVLPSTRRGEAAELLCKARTGFLPVVEPEPAGLRMLGIVTETDMLRAACEPPRSED